MISFKLNLYNPFYDTSKEGRFSQEDYVLKNWDLGKNKCAELQITKFHTSMIVECGVELMLRGRDHAGLYIDLGLFGYSLMFNITDNRHWNWEANRWYTEKEELDEAESLKDVG